MKVIERLDQFIKQKGMSLNAFDAAIGAGNGYIGKLIKNKGSVGSDVIEKIISAWPEIDINWLMTGKFPANTPPENTGKEAIISDFRQLTPLQKQVNTSQNTSPAQALPLKNSKKPPVYHIPRESESTGFVHESEAVYDRGAPKVITVNERQEENIVYVPVKARAGYLSGYGDPDFIQSLPSYRLPGLNNGTYRMFEVEGPSMAPNIISGDRVIGQWVNRLDEINDNRVYIVVCRDGIVVKRVLNRIAQRGKLVIKSDTINHRAEYPTYELDPSEVLEMWYARLKLSSDFSEPAEVYHRLSDLEADMVEVKQILSLIKLQ